MPLKAQLRVLVEAASDGNLPVVKRTLDQDEGLIDACDRDSRTPLHHACTEGQLEVVKHLLGRHARVDRHDRWGFQPLYYALLGGHSIITSELTKAGATLSQGCRVDLQLTLLRRDAEVQPGGLDCLESCLSLAANALKKSPATRHLSASPFCVVNQHLGGGLSFPNGEEPTEPASRPLHLRAFPEELTAVDPCVRSLKRRKTWSDFNQVTWSPWRMANGRASGKDQVVGNEDEVFEPSRPQRSWSDSLIQLPAGILIDIRGTDQGPELAKLARSCSQMQQSMDSLRILAGNDDPVSQPLNLNTFTAMSVTVIFVDIKGFTAGCASMSAAQVRRCPILLDPLVMQRGLTS